MKYKNKLVVLLAVALLASCSGNSSKSSSSSNDDSKAIESSSTKIEESDNTNSSSSKEDTSSEEDDDGYSDPALKNGYSLESLVYNGNGTLTIDRIADILADIFSNNEISAKDMYSQAKTYINDILRKADFKEEQISKLATFIKENLGLFEKIYDKEKGTIGDTKIIYDLLHKILDIFNEKQIAAIMPFMFNAASLSTGGRSIYYGYGIYSSSKMEDILNALSGEPKEFFANIKTQAEKGYGNNIYSSVPEYSKSSQIKLGQIIYHLFKAVDKKGYEYLDNIITTTFSINKSPSEIVDKIIFLANTYGELIEDEFMDRESFVQFVNTYADNYLSSLEENLKNKLSNESGNILTINKNAINEFVTYLKENANELFDGVKLLGRYLKNGGNNEADSIQTLVSLITGENKSNVEKGIISFIKTIDETAKTFGEDYEKVKTGLTKLLTTLFNQGLSTFTRKMYSTGNSFSDRKTGIGYADVEAFVETMLGFASIDLDSLTEEQKETISNALNGFVQKGSTSSGNDYSYSINWDEGRFKPNDELSFTVFAIDSTKEDEEPIETTITNFNGFDTTIEKSVTLASTTFNDLEIYFSYYVSSFETKDGIGIRTIYQGDGNKIIPIGTKIEDVTFSYFDDKNYDYIDIPRSDIYCFDTSKEGTSYFAAKIGNDFYWGSLFVYDESKLIETYTFADEDIVQGKTYDNTESYGIEAILDYDLGNDKRTQLKRDFIKAKIEQLDTATPGEKTGKTVLVYDSSKSEYTPKELEFTYYVCEAIDSYYEVSLSFYKNGAGWNRLSSDLTNGIVLEDYYSLYKTLEYRRKNGGTGTDSERIEEGIDLDKAELANAFYSSIPEAYSSAKEDGYIEYISENTISASINGKSIKAKISYEFRLTSDVTPEIKDYHFFSYSHGDTGANIVFYGYSYESIGLKINYVNGQNEEVEISVPSDMDMSPTNEGKRTYTFSKTTFEGVVLYNMLGLEENESLSFEYQVESYI